MKLLTIVSIGIAFGFFCYESGEYAGWNQGVEDTIKTMNKEVQTDD